MITEPKRKLRLVGGTVSASSDEQLKSYTRNGFLQRLTICIVLSSFLPAEPLRADFSGPVVSVLDGDTIEVLHNQHPELISLSGIDCPEKGQAYQGRRWGHCLTLHFPLGSAFMARHLRAEYPGDLSHLTVYSNNQQTIVHDETDRTDEFLDTARAGDSAAAQCKVKQ